MSGFRDLIVWQKARDLAVEIYQITQGTAFSHDFGLRDQIRRAVVSISSNIAEGDERSSNKDAVRFFYMAKGSLAELETQLEIAHRIGYMNQSVLEDINGKCSAVGKMLGSLIKFRSQNP
jgi:four helix bundle protein